MIIIDEQTYKKEKEINKSLIMRAITRKSKEWEMEKEWRILQVKDNDKKTQQISLPTPKCLFLDLNIESDAKKQLIDISKSKGMKVFQIKKQRGAFKLISEEIED